MTYKKSDVNNAIRCQKYAEKFRKHEDEQVQKAYRQKKKEVSQRSRDKTQKQLSQKSIWIQQQALKDKRAEQNARQKKCRALRKQRDLEESMRELPQKTPTGFPTEMAFYKATSKAKAALPKSPRKIITVCRRLITDIPGLMQKLASEEEVVHEVPQDVKHIHDFYERDDISYQAPGRKDCRKIGGELVQVRYLYTNIKETHALYEIEFPDNKCGKTKFGLNKPEHVLLPSDTPHSVCCCETHQNMIHAFESLHNCNMDTIEIY